MVNAINHHHQHNQRLHQQQQQEMQLLQMRQQQQMEQEHYAHAMQAKYVDEHEEEMREDTLGGPSVCVHIVMKVKAEWIHEVKFRESRSSTWMTAKIRG